MGVNERIVYGIIREKSCWEIDTKFNIGVMILIKYIKIIIAVLVILGIYIIDFTLISQEKKPIFVISGDTVKDGGTKEYYGLGYKVIMWKKISNIQLDGKYVEGKLCGNEVSIFPFFQDINDGPKKALEFISNN